MYNTDNNRHRSARPSSGRPQGNFRRPARPVTHRQMRNTQQVVKAIMQAAQDSQTASAQAPKLNYTDVEDIALGGNFADFDVSDAIKRNIANKGYTTPTPIQVKVIPAILEGHDVIGVANTGTGKTAAFLIPLIHKITQDRSGKVLIIAPTRELAVQIKEEFTIFAEGLNMRSVLLIGGSNIQRQKDALRRDYNFLIGTPGRIKDLIQNHRLNLSDFNNVVLDETDLMVDIGFIQDIKYFISLLSAKRQSLFFSATVDGKVKEIIQTFVKDPMSFSVKKQETTENVEQVIVRVQSRDKKIDQLHDLLIKPGFEKVIVFGRTKWGVQKISKELEKRGFKANAIHGNKTQGQRQRAIEELKSGRIQVLLATDVASRGLDIDNISHVINYDVPETYEDYVHRIGRTGRADKKGVAITFID